jgi:hypothetical protein
MKSVFSQAPFGRIGAESYVFPPVPSSRLLSVAGPRLGQLEDIPIVGGFLDEILDLIEKAPPEARDKYRAEYARCRDLMGGTAGALEAAKCFRDLYRELKEGAPTTQPISTRPVTAPGAANGFPFVPVLVAAGAGAVLIYFLTKGK